MIRICNKRTQEVFISDALHAVSFKERLLGLMFAKSISDSYALIFKKAGSIHTCFMRFPLDIIFLDKNMQVIRVRNNVQPWRIVFCKGSTYTIECASGLAEKKNIMQGDYLEFKVAE